MGFFDKVKVFSLKDRKCVTFETWQVKWMGKGFKSVGVTGSDSSVSSYLLDKEHQEIMIRVASPSYSPTSPTYQPDSRHQPSLGSAKWEIKRV